MKLTARNVSFIRLKAEQGLSANEIYRRCMERMVWDGAFPSVSEIV